MLGKCVSMSILFGLMGLAAAAASPNLLKNAGFEEGNDGPTGWSRFPPAPEGVSYEWDRGSAHSGARSVSVRNTGRAFGMWQQVVPVTPGVIYQLSGWIKTDDIDRRGRCCLQVVFRDADNKWVKRFDLPGHTGTRPWAYDFPQRMLVQAPPRAAKAEVNLFLQGSGRASFDDVIFGPAPSGDISGVATCGGAPVEGVRVHIWGTNFEATTDAEGRYTINGVPEASPRYVLIASKEGYKTLPCGDVDVKEGGVTKVNFELKKGAELRDPNLRVKFGCLARRRPAPPRPVAPDAVIDPSLYPKEAKVYLKPDEYVDGNHPSVVKTAEQILSTLDPADRRNTLKVSHAVYLWIVKNIEYDTIYSGKGWLDTTSGMWQTISGEGWCWGHNFTDWLYKPSEMLAERRGICIEHSRLAAALLRAVNIPARPVMPYSTQFWVQPKDGKGYWSGMGTSGGRVAFRERGDTASGFGRLSPASVVLMPIDSGPVVHSDWYTKNKCLWREVHPWRVTYDATDDGLAKAAADLNKLAETGEGPRPARRPRGRPGPRMKPRFGPQIVAQYADFTLNLWNIGDQRTLKARFPMPVETEYAELLGKCAYWTNHPECVKRTWISEERNPPVKETRKWYNIEFDLTPLLTDG